MTHRFHTAAAAAAALALTLTSDASAQERDPAAAQALFDQGQALVNAGKPAEACPKLAESYRLDPGIGTQFHLAACHELEGRIASAWAEFLEVASVASASRQDARAKAATRRASLHEPRLPRLKIIVSAATRAPGLEITRDGSVVGEAQWEVALPVDPGSHQIEATAPGRRAFAGAVTAAEGATSTFEVPVLQVADAAQAAAAPASDASSPGSASSATAGETTAAAPSTPPTNDSTGPSGLVLGLGIGGLVAIGAGGVLGVIAMGKNGDSEDHCDPDAPNRCNQEGVDLREDAFLFGNLSTVGFAVGGGPQAAAIVLWIVDDGAVAEAGHAIAFDVGPGGATLRGAF